MAQKKWLSLLGALPILAMSLNNQNTASSQDTRSLETIRIQSHPSKWDYPKEVIVRANQRLHIVVKGDTLWDLGQRYFGNPYAWPQIWELNKWVQDPHWIYPGDPLLVPVGNIVFGQGGLVPEPDRDIADLSPDTRSTRIIPPPDRVGYVYTFQDFLQLPYLVPKGENAHFRELGAIKITGSQQQGRSHLSKGDIVYLGGGQDKGLQVGDRMLVLKVAKTRLTHPDDRRRQRSIGDVIQHVATLRVLTIHHRNAEAIIEDSIDSVEIGDYAAVFAEPALISRRDAPLRSDTQEPISVNTSAKIIFARNDAAYFGNGSMVIIDKGSSAGFKIGDVLLAVKNKPLVGEDMISSASEGSSQTNRYLGQMLVVRTDESSSTCLILFARSEMTIGDIVTN